MAYANLVSVICGDKIEFFCRIRDFICKRNGTYDYSSTGIGCTLHDSSYATDEDNPIIDDWFVIKSDGEGGKDDLYFRFKWVSGYIQIHGFQVWDNFAHSGVNQYYTGSNFTVLDTGALTLFIYGDLDEVVVINKLSTTDYRACSFGKGDPGWADQSEEIATCSTQLIAGTDVSISLDSVPSYWVPGREIYIRTTHNDNISNVYIEKTELKTVSSGSVTADLSNSYVAGSALSDFVGYFITGSNQWASTMYVLIGENGTIPETAGWTYDTMLAEASFDPGTYEDRWYLLEYFLHVAAAGLCCKSKHIRRIPLIDGGLVAEDIFEEFDGTQWRVFTFYSGTPVAVKEV